MEVVHVDAELEGGGLCGCERVGASVAEVELVRWRQAGGRVGAIAREDAVERGYAAFAPRPSPRARALSRVSAPLGRAVKVQRPASTDLLTC